MFAQWLITLFIFLGALWIIYKLVCSLIADKHEADKQKLDVDDESWDWESEKIRASIDLLRERKELLKELDLQVEAAEELAEVDREIETLTEKLAKVSSK